MTVRTEEYKENSARGYTKDNIRVISHRANAIKRDATVEELEALVAYMRRELG